MRYEIDEYENKFWYNDDREYHLEDGSAIEYSHGTKEWWINGELHREDGPAIERSDMFRSNRKTCHLPKCSWFIHGIEIDCKDNNEFLRIVKMKELL
jgi:hypothetical protein